MFNEFPYTSYEKINLDWLLDLGNKLKEDAESGAFDGERGKGIFGITTIYVGGAVGGPGYYCYKIGDAGVGDFVIGYGPAAGVNTLYLMKVTSVNGNYLEGTTLLQITGPQGPQGEPGEGGLTEAMKQAFLQLARKVAYIDGNGQTYYDALYTAFYGGAPVVVLDSITAVFNQGNNVVYANDTLNSLKPMLTVTAHYSDSSTATVSSTDYILSGTLAEGTSTITVSYGGKTDTFTVTVTEAPITYLYNWDFTNSLVDSVQNQEAVLRVADGVTAATRDSNGLSFDAATQNVYLGEIDMVGKTIEIDVASFDFAGNTSNHIRFLMNAQYNTSNGYGLGAVIWKSGTGWTAYGWTGETGTSRAWSTDTWGAALTGKTTDVINVFDGKTVKVVYGSDGHTLSLYLDNVLQGTIDDIYLNTVTSAHSANKLAIGGKSNPSQANGDQCYNMTITGVRIYEN